METDYIRLPQGFVRILLNSANIGNCRSSVGNGGAIILSDKGGESGCDLGLGDRRDTCSLSEGRSVGAHYCDPYIFRALLLGAVFFPFDGAAAASVIRGDDESCLAAILRD